MFPDAATLARHPRVLNLLHAARLGTPYSQATSEELDCLASYAEGKRTAIEVGTLMGVSACRIARSLHASGRLYCVDPWEGNASGFNPNMEIAVRELKRQKLFDRVTLVRGFSGQVQERLPLDADFMFIDGDHSYTGIETDWSIVGRHLAPGGIVCLHDTSVPREEPWRTPESVTFFEQVIEKDARFRHVDRRHTLNVLQRVD